MKTFLEIVKEFMTAKSYDDSSQMTFTEYETCATEYARQVETQMLHNVCDEVEKFKLMGRMCQFDYADVRGAKRVIGL